jgi:isocitrate dehydrogenase kinase/phosphatase
VVPLLQNARGELYADALLLDAAHLAVLFSFARGYFMVDMDVPSAYVGFLRSLLPHKPAHEIYTMLGLQKHGKTVFYRDLHHHLKHSSDNFVVAPGIKGMVMAVFTLPSYVFKMIRDHFAPPKDTDKKTVKEKYLLVKYHDRVGRLADTLEYSNVAFPLTRFDPALLRELHSLAASNIQVDEDSLVIKHLYIERRMVPLNIYLQYADERRMQHGVREFGQAIKDLAGANIFPGDLLPKNFGVTRHGRVVFYDYDEIVYMSECNFRRMPPPRTEEEEMSSEPWYHVAAGDVFPEQFEQFLFTQPNARATFMRLHGDLAGPEFWADQQRRLASGVQEDVFPYPASVRFKRAGDDQRGMHEAEAVDDALLEELLP